MAKEPKQNVIDTSAIQGQTFKPQDVTHPVILGGPFGAQNPLPSSSNAVVPQATQQPSSGNSSSGAEPVPSDAATEIPATSLLRRALKKVRK
jgi:hypothetical protein